VTGAERLFQKTWRCGSNSSFINFWLTTNKKSIPAGLQFVRVKCVECDLVSNPYCAPRKSKIVKK